jgi:hypothetical protein
MHLRQTPEHFTLRLRAYAWHIPQALAMSMDVDLPDAATSSDPPVAATTAPDSSAPPVAATPAPTTGPVPTPSAPQRAPEPPAAAATPEQQPLLGGEPTPCSAYADSWLGQNQWPTVLHVDVGVRLASGLHSCLHRLVSNKCGAVVAGDADMGEDVEDPELMAALAMSMSDFAGGSAAAPAASEAPASTPAPATSTPQVGACAVQAEHWPLLTEVDMHAPLVLAFVFKLPMHRVRARCLSFVCKDSCLT